MEILSTRPQAATGYTIGIFIDDLDIACDAYQPALERHGISWLPEVGGEKAQKKKFKPYPIGYSHIDIAEVQTDEGRLYLFVAIDRTSKFSYAELHPKATRIVAGDFLSSLIAAVPYTIHTILTDNGIQFAKRQGTEAYWSIPFDRVCQAHNIGHQLTKVCHPWNHICGIS